jgi:hypothetical protein
VEGGVRELIDVLNHHFPGGTDCIVDTISQSVFWPRIRADASSIQIKRVSI